MEQKQIEEIISRAEEVKGRQSTWWTYYDDLARVHIPRMLGFMETRPEGERIDDVFDGTPMHAARSLANAIGGLLRPTDETWVRIRASDTQLNMNHEARLWLDDSTERLKSALRNPKARMQQCTAEVDLMLVVFGTAPFFLGENSRRDGFLFQSIPLKDAAIEWGEEGPMSMYRFRQLTVRQAESAFGLDNLGEKAKDLIRSKSWDVKLTYIHAVRPRNQMPGKMAKNMPFASVWIEKESKHIVSESGYHEFPYVVPRMETAPGEDVGRSPAMIALPDANTLQAMGETILIAGQRAADPPIFAPNDGSFTEANTFPGGISYYDADTASRMRGNPIFPLDTGHNLPITRDMQQDTREQVFAAFFRNILNLPIRGPEMTATEVIQRREEMMREVGPMFGRLEAEYTSPLIDRAFNIMLRAGGFAPIPDVLKGRDIYFEYESPIKRARQVIEVEVARLLRDEFLMMANVKPDVMDHFNTDEYMRYMAQSLRAPIQLLNPIEAVQQKREADAQAQAQQAEMMAASEMANIAKNGAGAVKQLADAGTAGAPA